MGEHEEADDTTEEIEVTELVGRIEALEKERGIIKDIGDVRLKAAQTQQAVAGKSTNLDRMFKTELAGLVAEGRDPNDPKTQREAMRRAAAYVTYAGPRVDVTGRGQTLTQEREALKEYNDLFDPKKMLYGDLSDEMDAARAKDKKDGTGTRYQDQIRLREYNRIRESMMLPPASQLPGRSAGAPSGGGSAPPPPRDYVIVR